MKRILVLTASTGGGHNQAAFALKRKFDDRGYDVKVVDFIKLNNKIIEKLFIEGYNLLYSRFPNVYGGLYKVSNSMERNFKLLKYGTKVFEKNVYKVLMNTTPDLIIGTHPFIVEVISMMKEKRRINLPFISVITDFNAHNIYINKNVDAYITGSRYTSEKLMDRGIPEKKIFNYGIPLREEFFSNKKGIQKSDPFTILLMGGSIGYKMMEKVLMELMKSHNKLRVFVVCGNNQYLRDKIRKKYKDQYENKEIKVYGFTEDIPILMEESHILISKPGGLTTSEAIAKKLPLIIPYMIPGQEEENAEFLVKAGMALKVDNIKCINAEIDQLIKFPNILSNMKKNMDNISRSYSSNSLIRLAENLINSYQAYEVRKA